MAVDIIIPVHDEGATILSVLGKLAARVRLPAVSVGFVGRLVPIVSKPAPKLFDAGIGGFFSAFIGLLSAPSVMFASCTHGSIHKPDYFG